MKRSRRWRRAGRAIFPRANASSHSDLGKAEQADSVEVRWPSGQIDRLTNVKAGNVITVQEGR